ncbi:MAG TPA: TolC family protein [Gemmatimonadales bacterium]|nr:TolC family protein [Gemmatimonadales bacterium]
MPRWSLVAALVVGAAHPAVAQQPATTPAQIPGFERPPVTATLSASEALGLARQNSPAYRQVLNDRGPARWGVRNAYASFLPSFNVSGGMGYTGSGSSTFGGSTFSQTSPAISSNYNYGFNWQLDGQVLAQPAVANSNAQATEADITAAEIGLVADVTTLYLNGLEAQAQEVVAEQQLIRAREFSQLSKARYDVGQATLVDVRQAEVELAQAEVGLLRARQTASDAKLQLFRQMGVTPPAPVPQIALVDSFRVDSPTVELAALQQMAAEQNPGLVASRARENAAKWNVRSAKSAYLPSLSARAGWSGFTQEFTNEDILLQQSYAGGLGNAARCNFQNEIIMRLTDTLPYPGGGLVADCEVASGLTADGSALDPAIAQGIRDRNNVFPFKFEKQPFQASLTISLPIFTGFGRQLRLSQAQAQRDDAEEARRARELQVRTDVESRYLSLQTSWSAIRVQEKSKQAAAERLRLAQDRYRLGSGTALELTDAQNAVTRAEGDYNSAVYAYHRAYSALEAAVGRRLR